MTLTVLTQWFYHMFLGHFWKIQTIVPLAAASEGRRCRDLFGPRVFRRKVCWFFGHRPEQRKRCASAARAARVDLVMENPDFFSIWAGAMAAMAAMAVAKVIWHTLFLWDKMERRWYPIEIDFGHAFQPTLPSISFNITFFRDILWSLDSICSDMVFPLNPTMNKD